MSKKLRPTWLRRKRPGQRACRSRGSTTAAPETGRLTSNAGANRRSMTVTCLPTEIAWTIAAVTATTATEIDPGTATGTVTDVIVPGIAIATVTETEPGTIVATQDAVAGPEAAAASAIEIGPEIGTEIGRGTVRETETGTGTEIGIGTIPIAAAVAIGACHPGETGTETETETETGIATATVIMDGGEMTAGDGAEVAARSLDSVDGQRLPPPTTWSDQADRGAWRTGGVRLAFRMKGVFGGNINGRWAKTWRVDTWITPL